MVSLVSNLSSAKEIIRYVLWEDFYRSCTVPLFAISNRTPVVMWHGKGYGCHGNTLFIKQRLGLHLQQNTAGETEEKFGFITSLVSTCHSQFYQFRTEGNTVSFVKEKKQTCMKIYTGTLIVGSTCRHHCRIKLSKTLRRCVQDFQTKTIIFA